MTDLRQAAQAALDALDDARHHMSASGAFTEIQLAAQDALRAALAAQQSPLKERPEFVAGYAAGLADGRRIAEREQAAQPVAQEPRVCWLVEEFSASGNSTGRYMLDQSDLTITTDVQKARQFRGSRTATFRATDMREKWGTSWRPVSHVFRAAQPQQAAQPVAPNIRAALQQAYLALEELDGPGYLIGGVMHHRISLLLPMLNKAIDSLADAAAQPQQATEGSRLSDLRGLLADAQPKQPNGQA